MKKIYLLLLVLFSVSEMKGQGCLLTYNYDSVSTTYSFSVLPTTLTSYFAWDFGDSTITFTSSTTMAHQFTLPGNYSVCVAEIDSFTQNTVSYCCVTVHYQTTSGCYFHFVFPDPLDGSIVDFTSGTNNGIIPTWDFGDGSIGTGNTVSHTYPTPGLYMTCMTSVSFFDTCFYCQQILITNVGPQPCSFTTYLDTTGTYLATFDFVANSSANTVTWDFGDGGSGTGINTHHLYTTFGTFTVCATEYDSLGVQVCQVCNPVLISLGTSCSFIAIPGGGPLNTFFFQANFDTTLYHGVWDFGDGTTITAGSNVHHTYTGGPGPYLVCMNQIEIITQAIVCTYCMHVSGPNPNPCNANFTSVPYGLDVYFVDYSTVDPAITSYTWDFGDGTSSHLRFPIHTYSIPGTYTACLTILNSTCADTLCQTLVVDSTIITPVFCTAYFIFTQLSPYQLAVVNLSSGTNLSFLWDFGDGGTSTAAYPIHNYATFGSYQICLTVADANGCTNTYCDSLSVDSSGMIIYRSSVVGFTINVIAPNQLNSVKDISPSLISSVYPNPSQDRIFITSTLNSGVMKYSILSFTNQKVKEGQMGNGKNELDISELSPGIYFIELKTMNGERSFARFIKE